MINLVSEMEEYWLDQIEEDLRDIPKPKLLEDARAKEEVMRSLTLVFLKIWMRFAIDLGTKMSLTPSDSELALYEGGNNWRLNESFNISALSDISITNREDKHHSLKVESYSYHGRELIRLIFSLEEERTFDRIVMVNYIIYDSLAKDFRMDEAIDKLKPGLAKWYRALAENELSILWNFCKDSYELVGV